MKPIRDSIQPSLFNGEELLFFADLKKKSRRQNEQFTSKWALISLLRVKKFTDRSVETWLDSIFLMKYVAVVVCQVACEPCNDLHLILAFQNYYARIHEVKPHPPHPHRQLQSFNLVRLLSLPSSIMYMSVGDIQDLYKLLDNITSYNCFLWELTLARTWGVCVDATPPR